MVGASGTDASAMARAEIPDASTMARAESAEASAMVQASADSARAMAGAFRISARAMAEASGSDAPTMARAEIRDSPAKIRVKSAEVGAGGVQKPHRRFSFARRGGPVLRYGDSVMDLLRREIALLIIITIIITCSRASVYQVGDDVGWAIIGNMDYNEWASSKTFQVGDILVFKYDPGFHNVMRVSRSDFRSCNVTDPISIYATGNDSIVIPGPGHYYYICGFVGHCEAGQKVDLRVPKSRQSTLVPVVSPAQAPNETAFTNAFSFGSMAPTPSPSPSSGKSLKLHSGSFSCNFWLLIVFVWAFC
ncbi:hypothetical protein OROGR_019378 [Orobanche gracilis]